METDESACGTMWRGLTPGVSAAMADAPSYSAGYVYAPEVAPERAGRSALRHLLETVMFSETA
jgi:hypothetical protein